MDTIDNWLKDINKKEEEKKFFFKSPTTTVTVNFLYISSKNKITHTKSTQYDLPIPNKLNKTEFIHLISSNKPYNYKLLDILIYQMTLPANELLLIDHYEGLKSVKNIDDILFEDVIDYFKDLSTIYVLLYEKTKNNTTKKIHISSGRKYTRRSY